MTFSASRVTVVIPAFNEAQGITQVVTELSELKHKDTKETIIDQILVGDNGSNDGTGYLAELAGATVIREERKGYGFACLACLKEIANQDKPLPHYVVFVDGDGSVLASDVFSILEPLDEQNDIVIGTRVSRLQQKNALSLHQRFGTYLACLLIRLLWRKKVSDLGPFRAIKYPALAALNMQDTRFGWTAEMQVKSIQLNLKYREVAVTTKTRMGVSKISGTLRGTIGAARGIFGSIFSLYVNQSEFIKSTKLNLGHSDFKSSL